MEQLLVDINAVAGVRGSFVCDAGGTLVAKAVPSSFEETTLLPAARTMLQTIEGLETTRRRRIHELDIVFHDSRMVVKNLRVGCLYVVCARNINVPLLNLTANVAAKKITDMLKTAHPAAPSRPALVVEEEPATPEQIVPADTSALLLTRANDVITPRRWAAWPSKQLARVRPASRCHRSVLILTWRPTAVSADSWTR